MLRFLEGFNYFIGLAIMIISAVYVGTFSFIYYKLKDHFIKLINKNKEEQSVEIEKIKESLNDYAKKEIITIKLEQIEKSIEDIKKSLEMLIENRINSAIRS